MHCGKAVIFFAGAGAFCYPQLGGSSSSHKEADQFVIFRFFCFCVLSVGLKAVVLGAPSVALAEGG